MKLVGDVVAKKIKKTFSLECLIALAVIVACSFFGLLFSSNILNPTSTKQKYSVDIKNNVTYQVYLKNNGFIDDDFLGMNQSYISSMVDSIGITFYQGQKLNSIENFNYSYKVYGRLSASYKDSDGELTEVWDKVYPLAGTNTVNAHRDTVISEYVKIPYQDYLAIVTSFKNSFGLAVDAKLDVIMEVTNNYMGTNKTTKMLTSIPMNEDVFQIKTHFDRKQRVQENETVSNMNINYNLVVVILLLLGGVETLLIVIILNKLLAFRVINHYEREKFKIKKDYGSIIVDVNNAIDFSKFTIFEIKTIEELVDLEEEIRIPILFYEEENLGVCYFVVIKDKYMYRFTLEDLEKKKKHEKKNK